MKRKNKNNNEEDFVKIKDYYTRALQLLESDEPTKGGKVILNEMPVRLYDMSLDILDNKNGEFSDQELRTLIDTVDKRLCDISHSGDEPESDIPEVFGDNAF